MFQGIFQSSFSRFSLIIGSFLTLQPLSFANSLDILIYLLIYYYYYYCCIFANWLTSEVSLHLSSFVLCILCINCLSFLFFGSNLTGGLQLWLENGLIELQSIQWNVCPGICWNTVLLLVFVSVLGEREGFVWFKSTSNSHICESLCNRFQMSRRKQYPVTVNGPFPSLSLPHKDSQYRVKPGKGWELQ